MEETEYSLENVSDADINLDRQNYNIAVYVANAKKFPLLSREYE